MHTLPYGMPGVKYLVTIGLVDADSLAAPKRSVVVVGQTIGSISSTDGLTIDGFQQCWNLETHAPFPCR